MLILLGFLLLGGCVAEGEIGERPPEKQIAVTFDDVPVMRYFTHPTDWHRALVIDSLTRALQRFEASATVFAVGELVEAPGGRALMAQWLEGGVDVGNHTMSHPSFNDLSVAQGHAEIARANEVLRPLLSGTDRRLTYFRFPYLAEGVTPERRAAWLRLLDDLGLENAPVTISNEDWRFDEAYTEAELAEDWAARYEVGQAYVQDLGLAVDRAERLSEELFGRPVPQVLLLHANRINRDYLGTILTELAARGYAFVSLDEAYADPAYREPITWTGAEGVSWLEQVRASRAELGR